MAWAPDRGDVVWIELDRPPTGHEQGGRRPALVLSPRRYNQKVGLALVAPITSRVKGYPFEVEMNGEVAGVILADQVRSIDWRARKAQPAARAPPETTNAVLERIGALLR